MVHKDLFLNKSAVPFPLLDLSKFALKVRSRTGFLFSATGNLSLVFQADAEGYSIRQTVYFGTKTFLKKKELFNDTLKIFRSNFD